jgi:glutamine amidotransferase
MTIIVDYGIGNLRSVQKAAEFLGKRLPITASKQTIKKAAKIILPGVAHFGETVAELKKRGLLNLLKERIKEGVPFFGICVGMQLLFEESEEAVGVKGLGIIKGKVKRFKGRNLIIPHMGWNQVKMQNAKLTMKNEKLFREVEDNSYFYFANSYYCKPREKDVVLTTTDYGIKFVSSVHKDNVWGVQFHPEKSQKIGLGVLENFLELC